MKKKLKTLISSFLIILVSIITSTGVLLLLSNYYLLFTGIGKEPIYSNWTLDFTKYSLAYIYWSQPWCKITNDVFDAPENCDQPEEKFVANQVEYFFPEDGISDGESKENCEIILFLGDSFTTAPWTDLGGSYSSIFSKSYAREKNICVKQFRIASGGAGNSQELTRFVDLINKINPNLVIWQFYSNDYFENVQHSLHDIENGKLVRKNALRSTFFWVGFINQKIPFIKNSTLGQHLLYLGETKDILRNWPTNPRNKTSILSYNKKIIPMFINNMLELGKKHNFHLITTLAPLECQHRSETEEFCSWDSDFQNSLRKVLVENSNFISMETTTVDSTESGKLLGVTTELEDQMLADKLFNVKKEVLNPGKRHLSEFGNSYFGLILFTNFRNSELEIIKND